MCAVYAQSPEILTSQGEAKMNTGAYMEADSLFKQALKMDNTFAPAMYQLAQLNLRLGDMEKAQKYIEIEKIWVNPDCGLKTRGWPEVKKALKSMTLVAKSIR